MKKNKILIGVLLVAVVIIYAKIINNVKSNFQNQNTSNPKESVSFPLDYKKSNIQAFPKNFNFHSKKREKKKEVENGIVSKKVHPKLPGSNPMFNPSTFKLSFLGTVGTDKNKLIGVLSVNGKNKGFQVKDTIAGIWELEYISFDSLNLQNILNGDKITLQKHTPNRRRGS